jgi:hypothetical protein
MMRFYRMIFFFLLILCTLYELSCITQASELPVNEPDPDEIAIMAAVLDSVYSHVSNGWVMVSSQTATFKCNPPSKIGLEIGGCNGMRFATETAEERLAMVSKEISMVTSEITADLINRNRESSVLSDPLPIPVQQFLYAPGAKSELKYRGNPTFSAYFSRAGFDSTRAKALIYLGIISWTDKLKSLGQYLYLEKQEGTWKIKARAKVWTF